jgi:ribosomal protein L33
MREKIRLMSRSARATGQHHHKNRRLHPEKMEAMNTTRASKHVTRKDQDAARPLNGY